MKIISVIALASAFLSCSVNEETCTCKSNFEWVKKTDIYTYQRDTVFEYPKNVGIIVNKYSASIVEGFLLDARQSKKVKTFGTATYGAYDILSVRSIESPCKEFTLNYAMARSLYMPNMTIDDIGIQPDFYLDKTIPEDKWVEFVSNIINQ